MIYYNVMEEHVVVSVLNRRLQVRLWTLGIEPTTFYLDVKPPNPPGSQKKLLSRKTKGIVSKLVKSHYVSAGVDL